jgi:homeobox protein cut-like
MVNEQVSKKELEMRLIMDERSNLHKETEYALQRQLNHLKQEILTLQSSQQSAQDKFYTSNQTQGTLFMI